MESSPSTKVSSPVTSWGKAGEIESPAQNGHVKYNGNANLRPIPKSEAESISVNDGGEAKRLRSQGEEIAPPSTIAQDLGQWITRAGTQFTDSSSECENAGPLRYVGSLQQLSNDASQLPAASSLASRLRAGLGLAVKEGYRFLPRDKFNEILTSSAVRQELKTVFPAASEAELKGLTDKVYTASETRRGKTSSATHRRKLFALLSLMEMVPAIKDFIAAGIYDRDLPFIKEDNKASTVPFYYMYRWDGVRKQAASVPPPKRTPISCFSSWRDPDIEGFYTHQWQLLAPHFELGSLELYNFHDNIILPFIENTSDDWKEGGFSDVWRVKIHPAHWHSTTSSSSRPSSEVRTEPNGIADNPPPINRLRQTKQNGAADNPSYAIKRLKKSNREAFDQEVEALKRFSDQHDLPLINLLLTYYQGGKYHLVFPWAEGNLCSFWREHQTLESPRRDRTFVQWAAKQWLGIARGLQAIHHPPPRAVTRDPKNPRNNGRHGDLKPENILWFKSDPGDLGYFVISDFGLTSFHRNETKDMVSPSHLARSPTYRPPECDVCETISQSYDIWSLGCILLEFVIWHVRGCDGVDKASERRIADERLATSIDGNYVEDKFFELTRKDIIDDDTKMEKSAKLKECVKKEFKSLREFGANPFFDELIEYIDKKLLRMRPDERATCDEIVAKFTDMYEKCLQDENYCTEIVCNTIDRTGTHNSTLDASYKQAFKGDESPADEESDEPEPPTSDHDSDMTNRPDAYRRMTESPPPLEARIEPYESPSQSKSSLKQRLPEVPSPPSSPTSPPRTDSNSTGEFSSSKRVSFAETHHYQDPSPEISQQSDMTEEPNLRDGKTITPHQHQQQQPKGDQKHVRNKGSGSNLPRCDEDEVPQLPSPTPSSYAVVQQFEGQDGGKQNSDTITGPAAERPATVEAQGILARGNPPIQPTSQTSEGLQTTTLTPPLQPTLLAAPNGEQQSPTHHHPRSQPDLEGVPPLKLFVAFCKSLWCF